MQSDWFERKSVGIRLENLTNDAERHAIRSVHEAAFGGAYEANLVDQLRGEYSLVSLVAESGQRIVGHILFSRMWINAASKTVSAVALAPVAVLPDYQNKGIGQRLITDGLHRLKTQGERIVLVVGQAGYYPRFGFSCERAVFLASPFPREAFMALELVEGALEGVQGPVVYPAAFGL